MSRTNPTAETTIVTIARIAQGNSKPETENTRAAPKIHVAILSKIMLFLTRRLALRSDKKPGLRVRAISIKVGTKASNVIPTAKSAPSNCASRLNKSPSCAPPNMVGHCPHGCAVSHTHNTSGRPATTCPYPQVRQSFLALHANLDLETIPLSASSAPRLHDGGRSDILGFRFQLPR